MQNQIGSFHSKVIGQLCSNIPVACLNMRAVSSESTETERVREEHPQFVQCCNGQMVGIIQHIFNPTPQFY